MKPTARRLNAGLEAPESLGCETYTKEEHPLTTCRRMLFGEKHTHQKGRVRGKRCERYKRLAGIRLKWLNLD